MSSNFHRSCFIKYKCSKCGAEDVFVYNIVSNQTGFYHALGGEAAEQNAKKQAALQALEEINKFDAELFKSININRDYETVAQRVICSKCGEKQIWSGIPCRWKSVKLFRLWIVGLVAFSIDSIIMLLNSINTPEMLPGVLGGILCLIILSVLPFIRRNKIKKVLKVIKDSDFKAPTYYNESNISELREELSKKEKTVICGDCGQVFKEEFGICPKCGKSI